MSEKRRVCADCGKWTDLYANCQCQKERIAALEAALAEAQRERDVEKREAEYWRNVEAATLARDNQSLRAQLQNALGVHEQTQKMLGEVTDALRDRLDGCVEALRYAKACIQLYGFHSQRTEQADSTCRNALRLLEAALDAQEEANG